jgi:hypothetical protein
LLDFFACSPHRCFGIGEFTLSQCFRCLRDFSVRFGALGFALRLIQI